jgi:hypothetical protein
MANKADISHSGMASVPSEIAKIYKNVLGLRKHDPPEIEVFEPTLYIGHNVYRVKGRDHNSEFDILRRFCEFDLLRKVRYLRFLGIYVPTIPENKAMGKTVNMFAEERLYFLDRFLIETCQLPYLNESEDF